jgi:hypothetical protein
MPRITPLNILALQWFQCTLYIGHDTSMLLYLEKLFYHAKDEVCLFLSDLFCSVQEGVTFSAYMFHHVSIFSNILKYTLLFKKKEKKIFLIFYQSWNIRLCYFTGL